MASHLTDFDETGITRTRRIKTVGTFTYSEGEDDIVPLAHQDNLPVVLYQLISEFIDQEQLMVNYPGLVEFYVNIALPIFRKNYGYTFSDFLSFHETLLNHSSCHDLLNVVSIGLFDVIADIVYHGNRKCYLGYHGTIASTDHFITYLKQQAINEGYIAEHSTNSMFLNYLTNGCQHI